MAALLGVLLALLLMTGAASATAQTAAPASTTSTSTTAADAPPPQESQPIPEGKGGEGPASAGMGGAMVRLFIGLLIVVALVVGLWLLLKRLQRGRYPNVAGGGAIEVLATTPLGPNRALHLVRVGGQRFLVGVTEHSVSPLTPVADEEDFDTLLANGGIAALDAARTTSLDPRERAAITTQSPGSTWPGWAVEEAPQTLVDRLRALTARRGR